MTAKGVYAITNDFEHAICDYTGAPYCIAVDCCSHAIFLALKYVDVEGMEITIPRHTFPSVPCEIIHAGGKVVFDDIWTPKGSSFNSLKGPYRLSPTNIYDSALRFTKDMYIPGFFMCVSFTGPRKSLKLVKAGAILTDNRDAYNWFKQARMSGRHEMPFMDDDIEFAGWNFYLNPEISTRGLMLMREFYDDNGNPKENEDIELEYPDLSQMKAFR